MFHAQCLADVSTFQLVSFMCADLTFESQRWSFLHSSHKHMTLVLTEM